MSPTAQAPTCQVLTPNITKQMAPILRDLISHLVISQLHWTSLQEAAVYLG